MNYSFSDLKLIAEEFSNNPSENEVIGTVRINKRPMSVTRKSAEDMELENPTLNVINGKITSFSNL